MDATMTNIKVAAYCAATVAFDEKKNVYDGFNSLVVSAIAELASDKGSQIIRFKTLRNKINELYPVNVNSTMLHRLLTSLKSDGIIKEYKPYTSITIADSGRAETDTTSDNYGLDHFFLGFCEYLQKKGKHVEFDQIQNDICNLIFTRSTDLAEFLSNRTNRDDLLQNANSEYILEFLDYLLLCEKERPNDALAYKRLYNGAIQASLLGFSPTKVDDITGIKITTVILDTNFIVRLLGLQTQIENDLAREMWDVLNSVGVEFIVLQSSIDEVRKSIKRFVAAYEPYQSGTQILRNQKIRSCGYLSAMQDGLTSLSRLQEYTQTANIQKDLEGQWKCVIFEDYYSATEEEISELISAIDREGYGKDSATHDLALIQHCKKLRKEKQTFRNSAGNALVWVLTEDNRLCKFCHLNAEEVQECITETQLSNLMWLTRRKDSNNGLVSVIVALATKGMITIEKYNSFIAKIHEYTSRKQNDRDALDCAAMVIANDMLTTQDINSVTEGSIEIDSLLFEKSEVLRQERINEQKKYENDILTSKQELFRVQNEKEEAFEHNRTLQRQLMEKANEAEQHKKEMENDRRGNELYIIKRNMKDMDRLSLRLDEINIKNGRIAGLIIIFIYSLVIGCVLLVVWKFGIGKGIKNFIPNFLSGSENWGLILDLLQALVTVFCGFLAIFVPGLYSLSKGKGFIRNPQYVWRLIKNDLSYSKVQTEVAGYDWFYEKIGNEGGLRDLYYEEDAGIDNIKELIKDTRSELSARKTSLDNAPLVLHSM